MELNPLTITFVTTIVASLASAFVAAIIATGTSHLKREKTGYEALKGGMRALLWRELQILHTQAVEHNGLTIEERRHLESVYESYHAIGGNGTGSRLHDEAMEMPVLND